MADDARVPVDVLLEAFGVPATVTRPVPDDTPIITTGIWDANGLTDDVPSGQALTRREERRVMALARSEVPTVPKGTQIVAPPTLGDADQTWRVDGMIRVDRDLQWVAVLPEPEF